jgi:Relaxase/Mobilisation nuclease domain
MSITKVGKAKSSADAVEYVLKEEKNGEKQPEIIGGNIAGETLQEVKDEFRDQEKLNFKVKNTVIHISVSFPTQTNISNQIATDYADELAAKLGFEMNPYVVVRHFDKDDRGEDSYSHIHIVASRINNDGTLISEWQIAERTIAATVELDRRFELQSVEYQKVNQGEKTERNIKKNEYRVMQKTGKLSVLEEFKDAADDTLRQINEVENKTKPTKSESNKTRFFIEKLQQKGFEVLPFISKDDGQMKGFSFKKDKLIFTASKAGKKFSWTNLATQLEYNAEKDLKFLVNLKDEVLAESVKKVLPTDGSPNPNPSENESKEKAENTENSIKTISQKLNREEFSEPQETQNQAEKKVETVLDANELFEVEDNKQTRNSVEQVEKQNHSPELKSNEKQNEPTNQNRTESQEKQNEKTAELTDDKPRIEPDKSINGNVGKEESNSEKQIPKLAETARNESDSNLEKVEIVGEESAEIRSDRADHETVGSRKIVTGNEETTATNNADRNQEDRTDEAGISDGRFSNSKSNQHSEAAVERTELENSNLKKSTNRSDESGGNFNRESKDGETELSEFQRTSRKIESGISEGRESERHFNFGDSDHAKQTSGSGKLESESSNFSTETNHSGDERPNQFVPGSNLRSKTSSQEERKESGGLVRSVQENTDNRSSSVVDNFSNSIIPRDEYRIPENKHDIECGIGDSERRISHRSDASRQFAEEQTKIGGSVQLHNYKNAANVSSSSKFLPTAGETENQNDSSKRPTNRRTAELTAQIINVKFYSGQLDKKIIEKWADKVEKSNPQEFLNEVIKPKTADEQKVLFTALAGQANNIAESLNLPKPKAEMSSKPEKLAVALTKIAVKNYEKETGIKVGKKVFERLSVKTETSAKIPPTLNQLKQIEANFGNAESVPVFSSKLEAEVFNSLLKPEALKFNKDTFLKIQESVRIDEIAATETVRLVQIAYGGQCDKFTTEFKSDLADRIYNQPSTATKIYNNYREFDWQKTVQNFAPIVDNLAEQHGITIQTPTNEADKNKLLTQNLAQQIIKTYEEQNNSVQKYIQNEILKSVEASGKIQVQPIQTDSILKSTDSKLEPPQLKSSLDANFHSFDKRDDKEKSERSKYFVEKVGEVEDRKIEKQRQLDIREEMFLGGRSM